MELTTPKRSQKYAPSLFMMSKIQNLNGTHNMPLVYISCGGVVYDVKDTKFEWNSQHNAGTPKASCGCL